MALGFTSYEVDADKQFERALDKAKRTTKDLRGAFFEIARQFYKFRSSIWQMTGPGKYPDLSDKYKKQKRNKWGFTYPILKASGKLERAMKPGGSGNFTFVGQQSAFLGVQEGVIPYAKFHQDGTKIMPMRKFLFIGPGNEVKTYTRIIDTWVEKQAEESGAFNG